MICKIILNQNYITMRKQFLIIVLVGILAMACGHDGTKESANGGRDYRIVGSVQKGPFVLGSNITIQPLSNKLNPTGQIYNIVTNDDAGHFNLGNVLPSKYVEISTTGYYFDEVAGSLSQSTLTLRSITDLDVSSVANVNLLTTLVM